ncbi:unnamed protein product [Diabrotica balteata]|uniref:Insulin-like domain-containing protein n=1 Tax=Diabrotica balteata TaxID=107213 RepID=A0A9N9X966_DIABA|nr:unnamed protein product [Diabrotica balteata]
MNLKFEIFLFVLIFVKINSQDGQVNDPPIKYCDDHLTQVVRLVCADAGVKSLPNITKICCEQPCTQADIKSFCKDKNANAGETILFDEIPADVNN